MSRTCHMSFELLATEGRARRGRLTFPRGTVETPAFMPVGTYGTVKGMLPRDIEAIGAQIILGNTFHLWLRPGTEVIKAHGDLHDFMQWQGPILTDSGGFQVFSLGAMRKIKEEGVYFASPVDGAKVFMGPEESMQVQRDLGSDIVMIFDECTPYPADEEVARRSMELSLRWARRSKDAHGDSPAALFGIVQGGMHESLRMRSLEGLCEIGFDGLAIGGLSVGEPKEEMIRVLDFLPPQMPADKPRYLMGVGKPEDLVEGVRRGVDMFDCVMPTRAGRHGLAYTRRGKINLKNARHADDPRPLDEESNCPAARDYSRAYLHHLVKSGEALGAMLLTWNNLSYYQRLMQDIRDAIEAQRFADRAAEITEGWARGDLPVL